MLTRNLSYLVLDKDRPLLCPFVPTACAEGEAAPVLCPFVGAPTACAEGVLCPSFGAPTAPELLSELRPKFGGSLADIRTRIGAMVEGKAHREWRTRGGQTA